MKQLPPFLVPGCESEIGSHLFTKEEIIRFAKKYDPQIFHIDEEAAKSSLFGRLCASGWHTTAVWMRMKRDFVAKSVSQMDHNIYAKPEYGPSPGFENLKWLMPVFAGDVISFKDCCLKMRKSASRPGWWVTSTSHFGQNQNGKPVISFESSVLINMPDAVSPTGD